MRRVLEGSRQTFRYRQILDDLRREAMSQPPGTPLPSEKELAARYGVSRMTARRAVQMLRHDGLVYVDRGRGVFVAGDKIDLHGMPPGEGFTATMRRLGLSASSRVLGFERREADGPMAARLGLASGDPVFHIERLRLADGVPMAHEITTVPVKVCPDLFRHNLAIASLYQILTETRGHQLVRASEEIEAGCAGRAIARLFRTMPGDPVLVMRRLVYASSGVPIEFTIGTYRADRYMARCERR